MTVSASIPYPIFSPTKSVQQIPFTRSESWSWFLIVEFVFDFSRHVAVKGGTQVVQAETDYPPNRLNSKCHSNLDQDCDLYAPHRGFCITIYHENTRS